MTPWSGEELSELEARQEPRLVKALEMVAPGTAVREGIDNTEALREDSDRSRSILERIPAGRWGEADDLGGAAVFLASPAAAYVTGVVLPVDGGWLAR